MIHLRLLTADVYNPANGRETELLLSESLSLLKVCNARRTRKSGCVGGTAAHLPEKEPVRRLHDTWGRTGKAAAQVLLVVVVVDFLSPTYVSGLTGSIETLASKRQYTFTKRYSCCDLLLEPVL